jgi:hypothetical protein
VIEEKYTEAFPDHAAVPKFAEQIMVEPFP